MENASSASRDLSSPAFAGEQELPVPLGAYLVDVAPKVPGLLEAQLGDLAHLVEDSRRVGVAERVEEVADRTAAGSRVVETPPPSPGHPSPPRRRLAGAGDP